jgi:hypothetical protein
MLRVKENVMTKKEYIKCGSIPLLSYNEVTSCFSPFLFFFLHENGHYLLRDNRALFKKMFGKPHFYFRGAHYYHCWLIERNNAKIIILSAKAHGTSYEQIGSVTVNERLDFLNWLSNEIQKN